jgi:lysophospholipase L1-like esterase
VLNGVVMILTILIACVILEIGLRIAFARSLDFSMEMWKYAAQLKQPVANPELSFAHRPGTSAFLMGAEVSINSHGHRDREFSLEKPPGTYRIVLLGDSTTFGWGVTTEETVAKILEGELNKRQVPGYSRFEVINAGVGNYNTVQEVTHYMTYDRAFKPDMVILEYFINDAEPVPKEREPGLLGKSYLLAFAVSRFDAMLRLTGARPNWKEYYAALYEDGRPGFEGTRAAFGKLADVTRADGTPLLVTILPELREMNNGYPFEAAHKKVKDTLAAKNVPVLELIDGLRGHGPEDTMWVTPADDHPNGKANALVVAHMLPRLLEMIQGGQTQMGVNSPQ